MPGDGGYNTTRLSLDNYGLVILIFDILKILGLNGLDKISQAVKCFCYGEVEVRSFFKLGCAAWTKDHRDTVIQLGVVSGSPA